MPDLRRARLTQRPDRALDPDAPPRRGTDDPLWPQRKRWRRLVDDTLPEAAARRAMRPRARPWPVRLNHCFARIILDNVCEGPWREAIAAPAWRNMDARTLARALALGQDILYGRADLWALDARSLALRGKPAKPRPPTGP